MQPLRLLLAGLTATAVALPLVALAPPAVAADPVSVRTGDTPETTVFPNDRFTVPDSAQLTGLRVDLPVPDCTEATRSICDAIEILNTTDGFDLQPRFFIPFTGDIDVTTVTPQTAYVEGPAGLVGLQELTFDPTSNVLAARSREQLPEQTQHTLVITRSVRDTAGQPLAAGLRVPFTTMSGTTELDRLRKALDDGSAYEAAGIEDRTADFTQPNPGDAFPVEAEVTTVFPPTATELIQRNDQTTTDPEMLESSTVPNFAVSGVGCYAFGSFESPQFAREDSTITPTPTTQTPPVVGKDRLGFALIVPAGPEPAGGWPVAVYGPGFTRSYFDLFVTSDLNADAGIATLATDPLGHGFGPASSITVDGPDGATFLSYGRGIDLNGDGEIESSEGSQPATAIRADAEGDIISEEPSPNQIHGLRGGLLQTTVDNMALVRAVEAGVEVPDCPLGGNGGPASLATEGVQYYGLSFGGIYGTMLMGTDPHVPSALLNVGGGPIVDIARLSGFRDNLADTLRVHKPNLLNGGPGLEGFTESWPLPHEEPITEPLDGAMEIQRFLSLATWYQRPGGPEPYAPLLRKDPRNGEKNVLYQVAFGDNTVPNVTSGNIIRAGDLFDRTTYYRNDRTPTAGTNPHGFLASPALFGREMAEAQLTAFLETGEIVDPDGAAPVFEVPIANPDNLQCLHYPHPQTGEGAFPPPAAGECEPRPMDEPQPDPGPDGDGSGDGGSGDGGSGDGGSGDGGSGDGGSGDGGSGDGGSGDGGSGDGGSGDGGSGDGGSGDGGTVSPQARTIEDACPRERVPADSKSDDDGDVHEFAIDCMVWWEIAQGTSATTYEPAREVTRAQMASFIARLIERSGGELATDAPDAFSDDDGSVHEPNIDKLAAAKIVLGTENGRYEPGAGVSRAQMATFLARGYDFVSDQQLTASSDYFADDDASTHEENINKAAEAGFTNGRPGGGYEPTAPVRRDAMASFLARTLDLLVEEGTTPPKQ